MKFKLGTALLSSIMLVMLAAPISHAANQRTSRKQSSNQAAKPKTSKGQAAKPAETAGQHSDHAAAEHKAADAGEVERITVEELKARIEKNEPVTILDVRSEGSYDSSDKKVKGAIRMPTDEIASRLKEIPQDRVVVTYCT